MTGAAADADTMAETLLARGIRPTVTWRCPKGCVLARGWWIAGRVLLSFPRRRFGQSVPEAHNDYRAANGVPPVRTVVDRVPGRASWWTGDEHRPEIVAAKCKHNTFAYALGRPSDVVQAVRAHGKKQNHAVVISTQRD